MILGVGRSCLAFVSEEREGRGESGYHRYLFRTFIQFVLLFFIRFSSIQRLRSSSRRDIIIISICHIYISLSLSLSSSFFYLITIMMVLGGGK